LQSNTLHIVSIFEANLFTECLLIGAAVGARGTGSCANGPRQFRFFLSKSRRSIERSNHLRPVEHTHLAAHLTTYLTTHLRTFDTYSNSGTQRSSNHLPPLCASHRGTFFRSDNGALYVGSHSRALRDAQRQADALADIGCRTKYTKPNPSTDKATHTIPNAKALAAAKLPAHRRAHPSTLADPIDIADALSELGTEPRTHTDAICDPLACPFSRPLERTERKPFRITLGIAVSGSNQRSVDSPLERAIGCADDAPTHGHPNDANTHDTSAVRRTIHPQALCRSDHASADAADPSAYVAA
jgi:hypothetical protein